MNKKLSKIKLDIYFLNMSELKNLANLLQSDFYFFVDNNNGLKRGRADKKINIINNIVRVLSGQKSVPTIIPNKVVLFEKLVKPTKNTKIYYGQYINGNNDILKLMTRLTNGKFKFGVYAQDILLSHWKKGKLLTFGQLAKLWLNYSPKAHPEWRYISYVRSSGSKSGWKNTRETKAKNVIKLIKQFKKDYL